MSAQSRPVASIRGLVEVVLNVRDIDQSLGFYRDILGLGVISPPERKSPVFLEAGAATPALPALVVLVQLPADAARFTAPRSLNHLALAVDTEDFDRTWASLTRLGFDVRTGEHPVIPSRTMYVYDPDGNEVELIASL